MLRFANLLQVANDLLLIFPFVVIYFVYLGAKGLLERRLIYCKLDEISPAVAA